ncbi:MAG: tetratricopeptide repeat protein [Anaerolineales bacterium]|nr:tetratricopeptide repeat protein [Anaerolineales bacterium]MDW8160851.1 tetratricopeptide repeat protein [Anaerolineales bacterium]
MASIPLRAYHRQIEEQIDQALYDRAIFHCRHILTIYPKCVSTYRLLGKALLENRRFGDASDIFQRVLSSLPDDFISHVGLSIIREDEGNLNAAIWHMERAFEVQPSNNAIQGELRRLYGRRDGFEPLKVNLNRGALARMYLKGNLHSQAIAEIRMALAEDPQRPDLEALLAKAYYETRQYPEAKASAHQLLAKLPYCYEALFILWQISLLENREKEAQRYLAKLIELDPYAAFLSIDQPLVELVPDTAVILAKPEEATPSIPSSPLSQQPEWAASLGVQIQEKTQPEISAPDWITEAILPEQQGRPQIQEQPSETLQSSKALPQETPTHDIPDWMRELGWQESELREQPDSEETLSMPLFSEETTLEELEAGEIPDWLREISPAEADLTSTDAGFAKATPILYESIPDAEGTEGIPSWLAELEREQPQAEESLSLEQEEIPDWLRELDRKSTLTTEGFIEQTLWDETSTSEPFAAESIPPEPSSPHAPPSETAPDLDLPEWLRQETSSSDFEPLPDWLQAPSDLEGEKFAFSTEPPPAEEDTKPVQVQPQNEPASEFPSPPPEKPPSPTAEDEAFAWLESLAAKQGVEEALLLSPDQRKEEPPNWIREYLEAHQDVETAKESPLAEQPLELFEKAKSPSADSTSAPAPSAQEELPEWLRVELEKEEQPEATVHPEPEIPEWLRATSATEATEWFQEYSPATIEQTPSQEVSVSEPAPSETPAPLQEATDTPDLTVPAARTFAQPFVTDVEHRPTEVSPPEPQLGAFRSEETLLETKELPQSRTQIIEEAWLALSRGYIDQAVDKYQALIRERVELDRIIQDLSNALYQYPMEVKVWMLLGDAYLRKDLLAEALDAYNKAEELLR